MRDKGGERRRGEYEEGRTEERKMQSRAERKRGCGVVYFIITLILHTAPALRGCSRAEFLADAWYLCLLAACSAEDLGNRTVSEKILLGLLPAGVVRSAVSLVSGPGGEVFPWQAVLLTSVSGILVPLVLFLPLYLIRGGRGFGGADVRFLAAAGAGLGASSILEGTLAGCAAALAVSALRCAAGERRAWDKNGRKARNRNGGREEIPLIPFFSAGIFLLLLRQA